MSESKPIQNKPLLFAVIALALVIAVTVARLKTGISYEQAREAATTLLPQICARECASHGVQLQDMQGPADTVLNHQPRSTKFEFVWNSTAGRSLHIRIWDNGLTVQKAVRWKEGEPWEHL